MGFRVFQVLNCLTVQHDWRLVGVAAVVCFFASLTAVNIFNRARSTAGRARVVWIVAAGVAAGFGIWATHFVAMLAYEPGIPIAYGVALTALSLAAATLVTGFGLSIAVYLDGRWAAILSGAVIGGGIAAMHYIGMFAVEIPGRVTWQIDLVLASIAFGMVRRARHGRGDPLKQQAQCRACRRAAHPRHRVASFYGDGRGRNRARSRARH